MKSKQKPISGDELAVGGQAVMEGVMMRGKKSYAVSVLTPSKKIERLVVKIPKKSKFQMVFRKSPFVRGTFALWDSLKIGFRALDFSADVLIDEEEKQEQKEKKIESKKSSSKKTIKKTSKKISKKTSNDTSKKESGKLDVIFTGAMIVASLAFALFLFKFLPYWITGYIVPRTSYGFVWVEGLIKACIFVGYLSIISTSKQIKRVFEFHGAEHKAVHCYEAHGNSKKLNAKIAQTFSRIHKRCGTTFLFLVIFLSIIVYAIVPLNFTFWISFLVRIALLPVVAGIAFEVLQIVPRLSNKNPLKWILTIIEYPGLMLQYITTREPNEEELNVAIDALKQVLKYEK